MLNDRLTAARDVAAKLFALEEAIDLALARAGELTTSIPNARSRAKLSAVIGQDAITKVSDSLVTLVEARKHILEAHEHLAETQAQIGLKVYNMGALWKFAADASNLEVVADEAA
jgi:hypothetical protein